MIESIAFAKSALACFTNSLPIKMDAYVHDWTAAAAAARSMKVQRRINVHLRIAISSPGLTFGRPTTPPLRQDDIECCYYYQRKANGSGRLRTQPLPHTKPSLFWHK